MWSTLINPFETVGQCASGELPLVIPATHPHRPQGGGGIRTIIERDATHQVTLIFYLS